MVFIMKTKSDIEWLTKYWQEFCLEHRLPVMSADELIIEYGSQMPTELRNKVQMFIDAWESYTI
jgi:hypothetical protein